MRTLLVPGFFLFGLSLGAPLAGEIRLSPGGPIATPQAARDAAREAAKPVRILVAEGTYPIAEPILLGPEDSDTTWEAEPGARPVFTGGRALTNWTRTEDGLWRTPLADKTWHFEQLWIGGERATRARTPNRGYFHLAGPIGPGVFAGLEKNLAYHGFTLRPEQYDLVRAIPAASLADLLITVTHAWAVAQCRVEALDDETLSVRIKGRSAYPFIEQETDQRFWMENFRAALDAPGEWFLDREQGEVLYFPREGEDPNRLGAVAPVTERFLVVTGAENLAFRGLAFRHAHYAYPAEGLHDRQAATGLGAAIEIADSRGIRLEGCEIGHVGEYGVFFKNGSSDSSLTKCHLHDLGGGGVRIGETARPEEGRVCRRVLVDDCILQHGGRLHPSACGVVLTHTQDCAVVHCDIGDFFYSGVSAGWSWGYGDTSSRATLVENNHIHHLGWAYLSDMGGFYGLGVSPGTVVRGNRIHRVASHRYGGWGLYTDEGSTDVTMENNLVHDTSNAGFHQHYGFFNTIRNNLFAFGGSAQIQRSRNEARLTFRYEGNIVVWDPDAPLLDGGERNWAFFEKPERGDPRDSLVFRRNLYWRTDGRTPDTLTKTYFTWEEWRGMGRDAGSLFADPLFEDLEGRDFRLRPGSPAEETGFRPWDLDLAGVRKDDPEWRALAAKGHHHPNWEADAKPWPAPPYEIGESFERVALGSIGVRGAKFDGEGKGDRIGVTDEIASPLGGPSQRSLRVQDAPGLEKSYHPILHINPKWTETGAFAAGFDIMAQPGADWFFEMRAGGDGEFAAGPYVRWQNGALLANNTESQVLAEVPPGEWCRIEIAATTGAGSYSVTLKRQDGTTETFEGIPCKPSWQAAGYLLFSGLGTTEAAFFIDNLSLARIGD